MNQPESVKMVVGCILRHPDAVETCFENYLKTTDLPAHSIARTVLEKAYEKMQDGETLSLQYAVEKIASSDAEVGVLMECYDEYGVTTAGLKEAITLVKESAQRRAAHEIMQRRDAELGAGDPMEVVQSCIHDLETLEEEGTLGEGVAAVEIVDRYIAKAERVKDGEEEPRLATGIKAIDETTNGYRRGTLNIIAARPKRGKSALALNIAINMARAGRPVYLLSYEMFEDDIGARLVSTIAGIDTFKAERDRYKHHINEFKAAREWLARLPLYFELDPRLSILDIPRQIRRERRKNATEVVIIDYLQLIPEIGLSSKNEEISRITRDLKLIAVELGIVLVVLSQLNRRVEHRDSSVPVLSDLRDSGATEQDADTVIFLSPYATSPQKQNEMRVEREEEPLRLTVAANRMGPTGEHGIIFDRAKQRFRAKQEVGFTGTWEN